MSWEGYQLDLANDPDVGNLSKMKTLIYRHLEHRSNPQLIGRLYLNQSQIYQKIRNYPLAYDALERAKEHFMEVRDSLNLALTYYYQGILLMEEGKFAHARDKFDKALSLISECRDEEILLKCQIYYQLSECLCELNQLHDAKTYLEEGVYKAHNNGYVYQEAMSMQALAQVYLQLGNPEKAKEYYYRVLPKWRVLKEERQMGQILDDLGYIHQFKGEYKKAINAFKYSRHIQYKYDEEKLPTTLQQLARIYLIIEPEKSREYCKEAISILMKDLAYRFSEVKEKQLAQVFFVMSLYCREKNDRKNMLLFLKESLKIYKKYRMKTEWNEVYTYYQKYAQPDEEMRFDETAELVKGLTGNGKFNLRKIVGQIS